MCCRSSRYKRHENARLKSLAVLAILAGGALCYFGGGLLLTDILPQVRDAGLSLSGDNMILNRNWAGNQLYILVALYLAVGIALLFGGIRLWRRRRPGASTRSST